jgi:enoyl-CoA hydratase
MGYISMKAERILIDRQEGRAIITVNNPERLNSVSHATMWELEKAITDVAQDDDVRVIVLTGAGDRAFVAGADITKLEGITNAQIIDELPRLQRVVGLLEVLPQPVIARINGIALGGGTELGLACDFRIASENAVFGLPEVRLGIMPGYGGTQRLPRMIGIAKAKELLFTGDQIDAHKALDIGLVNQVVSYAELDEAVENLAQKLCNMPPVSLRFLKEAVQCGMQMDLESAVRMESRLFALCFGTEDKQEGVRAFLEKRRPIFKGK